MTQAVLTLRQLIYAWSGNTGAALDIEHLDIHAGTRTFLYGPSGCGKSTLLGLMAGVLLPSSGNISLLGHDWRALKAARRDQYRADHVGYIFQQFNLVPYLSALQNVLAPCFFSRQRRQAAVAEMGSPEQCAHALLEKMGLSAGEIQKPARFLSVGQQQRVAAARALIGQPALIIADEPTSALDDDNCARFMQSLLDAASQAQSAVIFVSHNQALSQYFDHSLYLPDLNRARLDAVVPQPSNGKRS